MFGSSEDLTSDLDWMLQSGQVSRNVLLEALLQEHYLPVYRLALMFLDDPQAARMAVERGFTTALLKVHEYSEEIGVLTWLYQIALETIWIAKEHRQSWIAKLFSGAQSKKSDLGMVSGSEEEQAAFWQVFETLADIEKVNLVLSEVEHWQPDQVGAVLEMGEGEVVSALRSIHLRIHSEIWKAQQAWLAPGEKLQERQHSLEIGRWLEVRWPAPVWSEDESDELAGEILELAARKGARRRGLMLVREMAMIAATISVVLVVIFGANWLWPEPQPASTAAPPQPTDRVVTQLVYVTSTLKQVQIVTATSTVTPEALARPPADIFYVVQPGDTLTTVAYKLKTTVEKLRHLNRIPSGVELQAGQRLINPVLAPLAPTLAATPVAVPSSPAPLITPYSPQTLYQRLIPNPSDFASLWLDALLVDYGPLSYLGPPRVQRVQTWLSQDQFLIIMGDERSVQTVWMQTGGERYIARPGVGLPWFMVWDESVQGENLADLVTLYNAILSTRDLAASPFTTLRPGGREEVAERQAMLVDVINQDGQREARFWLDDQSNLVLGKQFFGGEDFQTLMTEVLVTQVKYYIDLPQEFFDLRLPWRGNFALDSSGQPIPADAWSAMPYVEGERQQLGHTPAPQGFNPAGSRLAFQYPSSYQIDDEMTNIYLFADEYLLSSTPFGNPWTTICDRSPDGLKVAYVSQPFRSPYFASSLYWFNLAEAPGIVKMIPAPPIVTQFAFAPDSRHMAVFGFYDPQDVGVLFIVDLEGEVLDVEGESLTFLARFVDVRSLVWSPDGEQLALIARLNEGSAEDYVMVYSKSGDLLYSSSIDTESNAHSNWPMDTWEVTFPVEMGRMDACAMPPGP
ncbi:MAG: LysM peptidoglycan-binding domain-containing protein [Chloroflexota bacterium]